MFGLVAEELAKKAVASAALIAWHFWDRILEEEKGRLKRRLAGRSRGASPREDRQQEGFLMDMAVSSFNHPPRH